MAQRTPLNDEGQFALVLTDYRIAIEIARAGIRIGMLEDALEALDDVSVKHAPPKLLAEPITCTLACRHRKRNQVVLLEKSTGIHAICALDS